MSVSLLRVRKIEEIASSIIEKANLNNLPVDIKKVANFLDVAVMSYDLGDEISGVLVLTDGHGTIGYNPNHTEQRRRFTIAHELAHYLLHKKNHNDIFVDKDFIVMYRRGPNEYSLVERIQEQEANAFAASILMPQHLIEKELKENNYYSGHSEHDLIVKLAKAFKVSVPAMTFRLNNLNLLV